MPGQVTHFYCAARISQILASKNNDVAKDIHEGFKKWLEENKTFKTKIEKAIADNKKDDMKKAVDGYRNQLISSDTVAIFSAFAAGAVGPDLWTLPDSYSGTLLSDIHGSWYFDLGHYNLSHLFPEYLLTQIRGNKKVPDLQRKYQTAYILGYISHIALDIVAHLKVNVFAGAYHQQTLRQWEPEQGNIKEKKNVFNNHNKIEHYLDAFVRFFCFEGYHTSSKFSDTINKFNSMRSGAFGQSELWNFPNYNDYYKGKIKGIETDDEHFLNLSTSLAAPFSHRYYLKDNDGKKTISFIRDAFFAAYNNVDDWLKNKKAIKSLSVVNSELEKLRFFNFIDEGWWEDLNDEVDTQYYYLHTVIPNLERVLMNTDNFYSPAAFGSFINGAILVGEHFIDNAIAFLKDEKMRGLSCLKNWNLDTGMAISIKKNTAVEESKELFPCSLPVTIELKSVLDLPVLSSWEIPKLKKRNGTKEWSCNKKIIIQPKPPLINQKMNTIVLLHSIGIEFIVSNTCFYGDTDNYDEIDADIFGVSQNYDKPWIIHKEGDEDNSADPGYKMNECIVDFKEHFSNITPGNTCKRASRKYTTQFWGHHDQPSDQVKGAIILSKKHYLPRHIKISTCRMLSATTEESGNFETNLLSWYKTVFPAEDMVFSIFVLHKQGTVYQDIFHKVQFTDSQLTELKKIKVIGVNAILIILETGKDGKITLSEAWIDGEKQDIS